MASTTSSRTLSLWMNGTFVGTWSAGPHKPDVLHYDAAWRASEEGRPLSLSLPYGIGAAPLRGPAVRHYFENLLPDSKDILVRLARRFNARSIQAFDLLTEIGRDCVGALEILPENSTPADTSGTLDAEPLTEAQVAQLLRGTTAETVMGWRAEEEDLRISIAGAQEKTALLFKDGVWYLPRGATPTTHILKLPLGLIGGMKLDMRESVENEWLCSLILRAFGLPVAACEPVQFEDIKVLVVERFDRRWWRNPSGQSRLIRLPQEDMCQATGVAPEHKYEVDGGPGIDRILDILRGSTASAQDRRNFFTAQLLFWMLSATDGHAKNFSLFLRPGGRFEMTPLYDVLSAHPLMGNGPGQLSPFKIKLAMAVRSKNAHWRMRDIARRHWVAVGNRHGITTEDGGDVEILIDRLVQATPRVVEEVRSQVAGRISERMLEAILNGLSLAAARLLR